MIVFKHMDLSVFDTSIDGEFPVSVFSAAI